MAFSKLKAIPRKAKERTVEGLNKAIFAAPEGFTPEERQLPCRRWILRYINSENALAHRRSTSEV